MLHQSILLYGVDVRGCMVWKLVGGIPVKYIASLKYY